MNQEAQPGCCSHCLPRAHAKGWMVSSDLSLGRMEFNDLSLAVQWFLFQVTKLMEQIKKCLRFNPKGILLTKGKSL